MKFLSSHSSRGVKRLSIRCVVVFEFSRLKKACRYEKGDYCKLARDGCATQNCGANHKTE
jgi:hypothetical protein